MRSKRYHRRGLPTSPWAAVLLAVGAGILAIGPWAAAAEVVDLELVLALDCSSSVVRKEFTLQVEGLAAAFEDPTVIQAIAARPEGIAVQVMQWSGPEQQAVALEWRLVAGADGVRALAEEVRNLPRLIGYGGTAIGNALDFAGRQFADNGVTGRRRTVDLSGDGAASAGSAPGSAAARLVAEGVAVNGLAISNDEPDLAEYYRTQVIGGPGAFVIKADDFADFAQAMQAKLVREIGLPLVARSD